jgi:hypothetical protein
MVPQLELFQLFQRQRHALQKFLLQDDTRRSRVLVRERGLIII